MHFRCAHCPAEFCIGCNNLFRKAKVMFALLISYSCIVLNSIVSSMNHVIRRVFMLIILVTACSFFVMRVLKIFRSYYRSTM